MPGTLAAEQNTRSGNPAHRYTFTGLLVCPGCKRRLYGARSRKGKKDYVYTAYHCRDYVPSANSAGVVCNPRHYNETMLLFHLRQAVRLELSAPLHFEAHDLVDVNARENDFHDSAWGAINGSELHLDVNR